MADRKILVDLSFQADTTQAKKAMLDLQRDLAKLGSNLSLGNFLGKNFTSEMNKAKSDIAQLQTSLQSAFNADTGKLDLTRFTQSLQKSGKTLGDFSKTLISLGPEGEKAFLSLSKEISRAEVPLMRIDDRLKALKTTLQNTLRWQISSSVLQGALGAIQNAYQYAQDLDKSLTNIRIVTGQSTEQMARFAESANRAAQALSTTTTAYTNASLIFYQQGLSDEEVEKRTNATIKMSNITGESVEHVSSYMTAIWNNFDDGSRSLENFGDVITELGAKTAASSEEIAEGMEKFAAVADTVGLSYDYAASAVATVVAQTRQSADIVGTAFKTLFARLEGLKLGETLEDGVDLNKYSQALETVGVNVLDVSGDLRDMDDILDDLGARWGMLNEAQKVALAQTVGGVRQYTQLIALMDNWDFFQENLETARNSEGSLEERQERYERSWKASAKRVQAAWEAIYSDLVDSDFFINLNDSIAKTLQTLDSFLDTLGGIKGVLLTIAPLMLNIFGDSIRKGANELAYSVSMILPGARERAEGQRRQMLSEASSAAARVYGEGSTQALKFENDVKFQRLIRDYEGKITEEDKRQLELIHEMDQAEADKLIKQERELEVLQAQTKAAKEQQETVKETWAEEYGVQTNDVAFTKTSKAMQSAGYLNGFYTQTGKPVTYQDTMNVLDVTNTLLGKNELAEGTQNSIQSIVNEFEKEYTKQLEAVRNNTATEIQKKELAEAGEALQDQINNALVEQEEAAKAETAARLANVDGINELKQQRDEAQNSVGNFSFNRRTLGLQNIGLYGGTVRQTLNNLNLGEITNSKQAEEAIASLQIKVGEIQSANTPEIFKEKGIAALQKVIKALQEYSQKASEAEKTTEKLDEQIKNLESHAEGAAEELLEASKAVGAAQGAEDARKKANDQLRESQEKTAELNRLRAQEAEQRKVQQEAFGNVVLGTAQAFGSLASAVNMSNSIMSTWDEVAKGNMTTGQALTQTIMSVSMLIPTLTSGIKALHQMTKSMQALQSIQLKGLKINLQDIIYRAALKNEIVAGASAEEVLTIAKAKDLTVTKALALATKELMLSYLPLIALITAIIVVYRKWAKGQEELQALEQKEKDRAEKAKQWREENAAIVEQIDKYKALSTAYKNNLTTREALQQQIIDTAEALEIENAQILAQAGAYDLLEASIERVAGETGQEAMENAWAENAAIRNQISRATARNTVRWYEVPTNLVAQGLAGYLGTDLHPQDVIAARFGRRSEEENRFVQDLLSLGLTGVGDLGQDIVVDVNQMSDEEFATYSRFIADSLNRNFELYGGAENRLLEEIAKQQEDWAATADQWAELVTVTHEAELNAIFDNSEGFWRDVDSSDVMSYADRLETFLSNENLINYLEGMGITVDEFIDASFKRWSVTMDEATLHAMNVINTFAQNTDRDLMEVYDNLSEITDESQRETIIKAMVSDFELVDALLLSSGENFEDLAEHIEDIINTIDITNLTETFATVQETLDSLKWGQTFDTESMQKFIEGIMGPGSTIEGFMEQYGEYFTVLAGGQYMMTGSIENFNRAVTGGRLDNIQEALTSGNSETLDYLIGQREALGDTASLEQAIENARVQLEAGRVKVEDGLITEEDLAELETEYNEALGRLEGASALETEINKWVELLNGNTEAFEDDLVTAYTTVEELQDLYARNLITGKKYQESFTAAAINSANALGMSAEQLENQIEYLVENNGYLQDNRELAALVAIAHERVAQGVADLSSKYEDYAYAINNAGKGSVEYTDAIAGFEDILQDLFNTDENIDASFIVENLEELGLAAEGDIGALRDLQQAYAEFALRTDENYNQFLEGLEESTYDTLDDLLKEINYEDLTIGMELDLDGEDALSTLYQIMTEAGISAERIQESFNSIGFELEPQYEEVLGTGYEYRPGQGVVQTEQTFQVFSGMKPKATYTGGSSSGIMPNIDKNKSGGGGSSKQQRKEPKQNDERYYTVTRQISDQETELSRLNKLEQRSSGATRLTYIQAESEALERRIDLQKEYLREIEDYRRQDQAALNFFGATYDENGVVTNYEEMLQRELNAYNAAVEEFNATQNEEAFHQAEERYNNFLEIAKQYDETNKLQKAETEKLGDEIREDFDNKLKAIKTTVELEVKIDDRALQRLEFQLERIQRKSFSTAESIANMIAQVNTNNNTYDANKNGIMGILDLYGIGSIEELNALTPEQIAAKGITQESYEAIESYLESMQSSIEANQELHDQILSGPVEAMKEYDEEITYHQHLIEKNISVMNDLLDISQLVYGNAGLNEQDIINLNKTVLGSMEDGLEASYQKFITYQKELEDIKSVYASFSGSEEDKKLLEQRLREAEALVEGAQAEYLESEKATLEKAYDIYVMSLDAAANKYLEFMNATDWDNTRFERMIELDDQYLDDYEKIYEFSKLTRDVNNSMDSMDTIRGKERLREITQEIADIEAEGRQVSQYEVDALRKKYELRLAEAALEDAQNAKSTVRMQRDNEGNWSYVYTADTNNVDKAYQNYEDKLYEYQKLNTDFIKNQQKNVMNLQRKYAEDVKAIMSDATLPPEERDARLQETTEYYSQLMNITTDQLQKGLNRNLELYDKDWKDYNDRTGYKISAEDDYITHFKDTYLAELNPSIETATGYYENWKIAIAGEDGKGGFLGDVLGAENNFIAEQNRILGLTGTSLGNFKTSAEGAFSSAAREAKEVKEAITGENGLLNQMQSGLHNVITALQEYDGLSFNTHVNDFDAMSGAITRLLDEIDKIPGAMENARNAMNTGESITPPSSPYFENGDSGSGARGNQITSDSINTGDKERTTNYSPVYTKFVKDIISELYPNYDINQIKNADEWLSENGRQKTWFGASSYDLKRKRFEEYINGLIESADYGVQQTYRELYNRLKYHMDNGHPRAFDTGGYTGAWGSMGKLAFLHQKELVLNAEDTENMLSAVQLVRDIVANIDVQAAAASAGKAFTGIFNGATPQTIDQNVRIEAHFPNVTNSDEIEEAFTNLVNKAAQYANRKF